jgi:hypothetical protein
MMGKIIYPSDLMVKLGLRPDDGKSEYIISVSLALLSYLKIGDSIKTSYGKFTRMSNDLIHMDIEINAHEFANTLAKSGTIEYPV